MCGQEGDEAVRGPSATLRDSSQVECGNHSSSMLVGSLSLSDRLRSRTSCPVAPRTGGDPPVLPFLSANRGRKEPLDRENPAVPHLKTEEPILLGPADSRELQNVGVLHQVRGPLHFVPVAG